MPVLVDADSQVIAGHGRVLACSLAGITEVPIVRLEHLSEHQKLAFMIADNRLTENSEWDTKLLGEELKILSEAELTFSLEATGFEMAEIDMFIEDLADVTQAVMDAADVLPEPLRCPVSRLCDIWTLGKHRVVCGNALFADDFTLLMQVLVQT